jgi:hypothetical protein
VKSTQQLLASLKRILQAIFQNLIEREREREREQSSFLVEKLLQYYCNNDSTNSKSVIVIISSCKYESVRQQR